MSEKARELLVRDVQVSFGERTVIDGLTLDVPAGESVSIMGRSGCGKSTLLNCIAGLLQPDSGTIMAAGIEVTGLTRTESARFRATHVGIVFQGGELLPELTARENVAIAGLLSGMTTSDANGRADALLSRLDVGGVSTPASDLSGGERARVAVARALIGEPGVLLADEPTGSLDAELREDAQRLLYSLPAEYGCVLVVVTHDPAVAAGSTRSFRMNAGALELTRDRVPS